jgi:hypothetical protein
MPPKVLQTVNTRKTTAPPQITKARAVSEGPLPPKSSDQSQLRKVSRRSSKPIINWFQRKLAGTVKARRTNDFGLAGVLTNGSGSVSQGLRDRALSTPNPSYALSVSHVNGVAKSDTLPNVRRKTISSNEFADLEAPRESSIGEEGQQSTRSSAAFESIWSPASAFEADEDASVRPIPPSPPSPSPSPSSASYLSDPKTFKSMTASTKPTTLISVDLTNNGMAHIAQFPTTSLTHITRLPTHARTASVGTSGGLLGSGASITFSTVTSPSPPSSRPSSVPQSSSLSSSRFNASQEGDPFPSIQAPLHTTHHPRNNPRPSSPPPDNASVLTLASSAFALPRRHTEWDNTTFSGIGGDSTSQFENLSGEADPEDDGQSVLIDEESHIDASVRALRPRSSRRGSWGSELSRWSARVGLGGPATSSLNREKSLGTANSVRTDGQARGDREQETDGRREEEEGGDASFHTQPQVDQGTNEEPTSPSNLSTEPVGDKSSPLDSPAISSPSLKEYGRTGSAIPLTLQGGHALTPQSAERIVATDGDQHPSTGDDESAELSNSKEPSLPEVIGRDKDNKPDVVSLTNNEGHQPTRSTPSP